MKARLVKSNGVYQIEINGERIHPVSYRSFRPSPETTRAFSTGGMRLMTVFPSGIKNALKVPYSQFGEYWLGEGKYDWDVIRRQMDQFIENAPNAYFSLMLMLDTRDWFLREHPEAVDSFRHISAMAGNPVWRESAARMLRDVLDFVNREYPEKIFCVYLCAGGTCEWYDYPGSVQQIPVKEACYRSWSGDPDKKIPSDELLNHKTHGDFRDPQKDRDTIDFYRFRSEITADAICYFADVVKRHTRGDLLVGCFYGYLLYDLAVERANLAMQRVLECGDIDLIFSPASYDYRGLESTCAEHLPIESAYLHGKLYLHEIDNTTYFSNDNEFAKWLQNGYHRRHETFEQTVQYSRREAALAMSKLAGHWWFDMFGGWYDDERMMAELMKIRRANERLYSMDARLNSQIAVFIDEESVLLIDGSKTLTNIARDQREELGRLGCPVDFYTSLDLLNEAFPHENYKLYLFMNQYAASDKIREKVAALRKNGKSFLFYHAAGAVTARGMSEEAMSGFTGIRLAFDAAGRDGAAAEKDPGALDEWTALSPLKMAAMRKLEDGTVRPRIRCADDGAVAVCADQTVLKQREAGFDAWTGVFPLKADVLREMAKQAGVFLYQEQGLPTFANSRMLSLFSHQGGEVRVRLPYADGFIEELYTGERHEVTGEAITLFFEKNECKTFIYLEE